MYQVTAIYMDSELAYGEGEDCGFAIVDCIQSIESMYLELLADDVELHIMNESGMKVIAPLTLYI